MLVLRRTIGSVVEIGDDIQAVLAGRTTEDLTLKIRAPAGTPVESRAVTQDDDRVVSMVTMWIGETVRIGANVRIMVTDVRQGEVYLGISAPPEMRIIRRELRLKMERDGKEWQYQP